MGEIRVECAKWMCVCAHVCEHVPCEQGDNMHVCVSMSCGEQGDNVLSGCVCVCTCVNMRHVCDSFSHVSKGTVC